MKKRKDGFGYDLDQAMHRGNFFERVFHQTRINFWLKEIDRLKEKGFGKKILEVGCNTGILLVPLLKKKFDVVGIDISKREITKAREKLQVLGFPKNRARVADAQKLPFSARSFDLVLLADILEHVSQPELVTQEALRVTQPGGLILVTVPNQFHPVVKFIWLRKLLSGRRSIDEHPDVPYNLKKLLKLFPKTIILESRLAGFGTLIFTRFKKPDKPLR